MINAVPALRRKKMYAFLTNMNGSKTEEIAELLKAVPVHPDKIEINTENYASGSNTSITRKYKSDAPFIECLQQCKLLAPPNGEQKKAEIWIKKAPFENFA